MAGPLSLIEAARQLQAIAHLPEDVRAPIAAGIEARTTAPVAAIDTTPLSTLLSHKISTGARIGNLSNDTSVVMMMLNVFENVGGFLACPIIRLCWKAPNLVLRSDQGSGAAYMAWLAQHGEAKPLLLQFMLSDTRYVSHATPQGRMEEEATLREMQYVIAKTAQKILSLEIFNCRPHYKPEAGPKHIPKYEEVVNILYTLGAYDFIVEGDYKAIGKPPKRPAMWH